VTHLTHYSEESSCVPRTPVRYARKSL
jgi:hypothetical protein